MTKSEAYPAEQRLNLDRFAARHPHPCGENDENGVCLPPQKYSALAGHWALMRRAVMLAGI